MKIIAFGASTSSASINKQLATYTANLLDDAEVEVLDLNDYEAPLFSENIEKTIGQAPAAQAFLDKLASADALVVSFAEHNGSYTAAYKNLFDWCSRITRDVFGHKPCVYLATSPGKGGAANVLAAAVASAPHFAATVKAHVSVPAFYENFDMEKGEITQAEIQQQLLTAMQQLSAAKRGTT